MWFLRHDDKLVFLLTSTPNRIVIYVIVFHESLGSAWLGFSSMFLGSLEYFLILHIRVCGVAPLRVDFIVSFFLQVSFAHSSFVKPQLLIFKDH